MKKYPVSFDFASDDSRDCRAAKNTPNEGKKGQYFGKIMVAEEWWSVVLWEGDQDPIFYKSEWLEVAATKYVRADEL